MTQFNHQSCVGVASTAFSRLSLAAVGALALASAMVASAQTAVAPQAVKPEDVAAAPVDDLNLRADKKKIPPILEAAKAHPYTIPGGGNCAALNKEVVNLNEALGPDIDEVTTATAAQKRSRTVGTTAQAVVGSLIPFSGVIRVISGADAEQRRRALFIYAGSVRRGFIKGYANAHACRIKPYVPTTAEKKAPDQRPVAAETGQPANHP